MKVSLNWVKEYTNIEINTDQLLSKIGAQLGAIEGVIQLGDLYEGIYVVKVVECEPHPKADKLSLCRVDDAGAVENVTRDDRGLVQVVCGAPNVQTGVLAAWIAPGATVPATHKREPFVIEPKEIRGMVSNGMLASPKELAISDSHEGILLLNDDASPGVKFSDYFGLNDTIIDIENKMFTHRPDLFGQIGVAREVAGISANAFKSPDWYMKVKDLSLTRGSTSVEVKNEIPDLVPRFMVQVITGVNVKPSSAKIQSYLARVGMRPINNIVDLTNYFMMLTAQPLHAYDYDKLKKIDNKDKATIVVRNPIEGEQLTLLNGKTIKLVKSDILIASSTKPVGLGGVMGGSDTEVDENTQNVVLECANFDMYAVRRTSMEHGLFTDAVTRFNKGQSPLQNDKVLAEIVSEILEAAGGEVEAPIDIQSTLPRQVELVVDKGFVNKRLGLDLAVEKIAELLRNVEFEVNINGDDLGVKTPFWRTDIHIQEDIVEEVGRLHGYDNLILDLPRRSIKAIRRNDILSFKSKVSDLLVRAGANEVLTYSFTHEKLIQVVGQDKGMAFQLANAKSPELQYYRMTLLPSLLEKVHANIKSGFQEFGLFEINKTHIKNCNDEREPGLPYEFYDLAMVVTAEDKHAGEEYSGAAYYLAKYYLDYLLYALGIDYEIKGFEQDQGDIWKDQLAKVFEPIRSGALEVNGEVIGYVGEPSIKIKNDLKLPKYTSVFEVDLMKLLKNSRGLTYTKLSNFPFIEQDICFKLSNEVSYQDLAGLLNSELSHLLEDCHVVLSPLDIFQRKDDQSNKQVTFRLRISSYSKTLTSGEVNDLVSSLGSVAEEKFGAVII